MSNKTQLQTNNTKVASLIETLRDKAVGSSGEDVTEETTAYTNKIVQLETAVIALETELAGKASGGTGGGSISTCTMEIHMQSGKKCQATTIDENGNIIFSEVTSVTTDSSSGGIAIIENVVCNSFIYCGANLKDMPITGTATLFMYNSKDLWTLLKSPSVANEHCIISW